MIAWDWATLNGLVAVHEGIYHDMRIGDRSDENNLVALLPVASIELCDSYSGEDTSQRVGCQSLICLTGCTACRWGWLYGVLNRRWRYLHSISLKYLWLWTKTVFSEQFIDKVDSEYDSGLTSITSSQHKLTHPIWC